MTNYHSIKRRDFLRGLAIGLGGLIFPFPFSRSLYGNSLASFLSVDPFLFIEPEWILHDDGTFDLITGSISLLNCRPTIDGQSIFAKNIFKGDSPKGKRIIYELEGNSYVMIDLKKNGNSVSIGAELSSFSHAPYWFCPIGEARLVGADQFFLQGRGTDHFSEIVSLESLKKDSAAYRKQKSWTYDSYYLTSLMNSSKEIMVMGVYDQHQFISRSTYYNHPYRNDSNGETQGNGDIFMETGFFMENILLKDTFVKVPDIYVLGGNKFHETMCAFAWNSSEKLSARKNSEIGYVWSSELRYGKAFSLKKLEQQLHGFDQFKNELLLDVILIGDCYCNHHGDWLEYSDQWPGGLSVAAREIFRRNCRAGVWVAPFLADEKSHLFRRHSNWFLTDRYDHFEKYKLSDGTYRYVLDISRPEVLDYLRKVFHSLRKIGFLFFELDYLEAGLVNLYDVKRFRADVSSVQLLVDAMSIIRKEIGEGSFILSNHAPYGPLIGIVDAMNIVSAGFKGLNYFNESNFSQYMNGNWWRNHYSLSNLESDQSDSMIFTQSLLKEWIAFLGGIISLSANLEGLKEEDLADLKFLSPGKRFTNPARFLSWTEQDSIKVAVRNYRNGKSWGIFILNLQLADFSSELKVDDLVGEERCFVYFWNNSQAIPMGERKTIPIRVKAGKICLFYLSKEGQRPTELSINGEVIR